VEKAALEVIYVIKEENVKRSEKEKFFFIANEELER